MQSVMEKATQTQINDEAVSWLDALARREPFDERLLQSAPAHNLRARCEAVVSLLRGIDINALNRSHNLIGRLSGADVEARLRFEMSMQTIGPAVAAASVAAQQARNFLRKLQNARASLIQDNPTLATDIEHATWLLDNGLHIDEQLTARYQRRVSNLMALHAANEQAIAQFALAQQVLIGLIDRFTDVETMLLPVWQRSATALVHACDRLHFKQSISDFSRIHKNLIASLEGQND